jgi:long-chain acyl-CoA synthetase
MVVGDGQKFAAAIVVPAFQFIRDWAARKNIKLGDSNADIASNKEVFARIMQEVEKMNKDLAQYETIKTVVVAAQVFSVDTGELTPKLSLKRKIILKKYESEINKVYQES